MPGSVPAKGVMLLGEALGRHCTLLSESVQNSYVLTLSQATYGNAGADFCGLRVTFRLPRKTSRGSWN